MKDTAIVKELINKNKKILEEKYKVKVLGIFGSYARRDLSVESDMDIRVEFSEPIDIFEFIRLEEFLRKLLGAKVDLVSTRALKPLIKDEILKETIYI